MDDSLSPRKKKPVPVEKIVAKLKYLKEFKDPANKLDLVSVHPTKLHGASEAWVYDTAKRKLHHYIADEYSREEEEGQEVPIYEEWQRG